MNSLFFLLSAISALLANNPKVQPERIHTYTGMNAGIVLDYSKDVFVTTRYVVLEVAGTRGISICDEGISEDCEVFSADDKQLNAIAKKLGCKVWASPIEGLNYYDCRKNIYNLK